MSRRKWITLLAAFTLVAPLMFYGCGDDGDTGPQGPAGPPGPGVTSPLTLESCAICHDDETVRDGNAHQADYDERFQDNVIRIVPGSIAYSFIQADNTHNVTFTMKEGEDTDFDCTQIKTGAPADSLSIGFAQYTDNTRSFDPPPPLPVKTRMSLGSQSTLTYLGAGVCRSTVKDNTVVDNVVTPVGDLSGKNGIIEINGRHDRQGVLPSPSRVQLALHPFAGLLKLGTVNYVSAANVTGCEKCHTVPYLKHGFIYGRVDGDPATDFYTCKGCHMDNGPGGHLIWQLLVDNPQLAATYEAAGEKGLTPEQEAQYAYKTRLMNDVHMSHAMEFAYPQSMANCATCHEGKLTSAVLTDNNFVIETCKSCHPVTGGTDSPNADNDLTVDTRTINPLNKQAPALASILPGGVSAHSAPFNTVCNTCHNTAGSLPVFSAIHTGYDKKIYGTDNGVKYSSNIKVTIDNVSFVDNTNTLKFGFHSEGSLGGLSFANIKPTILIGLYGFDSKDYLFGPHESQDGKRLLEFSTDNVLPSNTLPANNSPHITVTGGAGTWNVTADLSTWNGWIDNGSVKRVEVAVMPRLEHPDLPKTFTSSGGKSGDNVVALNAPSKTFNLKTGLIEDDPPAAPNPPAGHANDFFGNSIVKVSEGTGTGGYVSGCNNCHDALATTFHTPDRGGNVVVCRLCHITKAAGSHLELQSRSIDSYTHAIHRFQAFDTGDIDFDDPVEAMEYRHHVESNFPTFGVENCRACHNAGKFNVPNQALSMPGVLSNTDFSTVRNIVAIDCDVITGPATRACGACHRAEAIIANEGMGDPVKLANINSHMTTFGYMIKSPPPTILEVIVQVFAMLGEPGESGITLATP